MGQLEDRKAPFSARYGGRLACAALCLLLFIGIAVWMTAGGSAALDDQVRQFAYSIRTEAGNRILPLVTQMASSKWIIGWIVLLLVIPWTRLRIGLPLGVTQAITYGLYAVLKPAFARPRPDAAMWLVQEHGFSFPSGHSMNGIFFYIMLIYLIRRNVENRTAKNVVTVLFLLTGLTVALSRIYVGVHYFTDVAAGLSLGTACALVFTVVLDEFFARRQAAKGTAA